MENKKLQHLNIFGNKIGDSGVRYVAKGLCQNDILTELVLCDSMITAKGNCSYN